ncbi:MAG: AzlC family ABC transporter permease [Acetobacteraceae bacterium]|nr:AzlC family ABC transporter permease [Acetobacteraceae bacterium]
MSSGPILSGLRPGFASALGAPALAMGATFLAFGAAVREAGLPLHWALGAALLVYGMPGQLVLLQFAAGGGGGPAPAVLGAVAANARFLPMAVALTPWLGSGGAGRWRGARFLALPFIAITPWAAAMQALPGLEPGARLPWFLGFALASWTLAGTATAAGHALMPLLDPALLAALLFANPLYFALLLAAGARAPDARSAALAGALAAPVGLLLPPAWALLGAGLLGGTLAFLFGRR